MKIYIFELRFTLLKRLKSRKNRTLLVENSEGRFVLKLYRSPHHRRSALEHRVLTEAHRSGIAVPRPMAYSRYRALLMEYIPGENLCDLLNRQPSPEYADALARWLGSFHHRFRRPGGTTLLRGDTNLRNFILHAGGALYGVDFEEAAPGAPARDLGRLCASILDTDPMFTPAKAALCRRLIVRYRRITGLKDPDFAFTAQIVLALREAAHRRPQQRHYLLKNAVQLEQKGLTHFP
jgi:aminoglycoside phosphotransferase (APT) family kinase protein